MAGIFLGHAVSLALDHKLMGVLVLPAHNALQDSVEPGERNVTPHLHTSPDVRLRAPEGNFNLVNFYRL